MNITEQNIVTLYFENGITKIIIINAKSRETVKDFETEVFESITEVVEFYEKRYDEYHISGFNIQRLGGGFISTGVVNKSAE